MYIKRVSFRRLVSKSLHGYDWHDFLVYNYGQCTPQKDKKVEILWNHSIGVTSIKIQGKRE